MTQQNTPGHNVKQKLKGYSVITAELYLIKTLKHQSNCDKRQLFHIVFDAESIYRTKFSFFSEAFKLLYLKTEKISRQYCYIQHIETTITSEISKESKMFQIKPFHTITLFNFMELSIYSSSL